MAENARRYTDDVPDEVRVELRELWGDELESLRSAGPPFLLLGWGRDAIGLVIDDDTDWDEVRELVTESYCLMAPKKLVALVDRPPDPSACPSMPSPRRRPEARDTDHVGEGAFADHPRSRPGGVVWFFVHAVRRRPRRTTTMREPRPTHTTMSIAESIALAGGRGTEPVTFERFDHVVGPFFHGTPFTFAIGDLLVPGRPSNYQDGRIANHVYFASLLEPAVWAAELGVALRGVEAPGRIYVVEPVGPFEDDPNVTDKRFPGNVTRSFRTRDALRIVDEVRGWEPHPPEVLQGMLDNLARLREQGLDVIED